MSACNTILGIHNAQIEVTTSAYILNVKIWRSKIVFVATKLPVTFMYVVGSLDTIVQGEEGCVVTLHS